MTTYPPKQSPSSFSKSATKAVLQVSPISHCKVSRYVHYNNVREKTKYKPIRHPKTCGLTFTKTIKENLALCLYYQSIIYIIVFSLNRILVCPLKTN